MFKLGAARTGSKPVGERSRQPPRLSGPSCSASQCFCAQPANQAGQLALAPITTWQGPTKGADPEIRGHWPRPTARPGRWPAMASASLTVNCASAAGNISQSLPTERWENRYRGGFFGKLISDSRARVASNKYALMPRSAASGADPGYYAPVDNAGTALSGNRMSTCERRNLYWHLVRN